MISSAFPLSFSDLPPRDALDRVEAGEPISLTTATALLGARGDDLDRLLTRASAIRDDGLRRAGRPGVITYSKKVFLPITRLCQDRCHYCIFVDTPGGLAKHGITTFMEPDEIISIAQVGAGMGCKEALFTLGDRPEKRWPAARSWLAQHGYGSTLEYVGAMAQRVLDETGLIPHLNPGVMSWNEMQRLRPLAGSMGMMLETTATRLWSEPGGAHFGSPDKDPALRLRVIEDAGRSRIPFTSGVLLGIGENHAERAEALFALRELHGRFGHLQETIVQNFRSKPRTAMQNDPDLGLDEYIAAVATARIVMGPDATVQAPPNLTDLPELGLLLRAGINDWGGISPLTADHVNPERPWPDIDLLAELTGRSGFALKERLTAYPEYLADADRWLDPNITPALHALMDPETLLADESARVAPRRTAAVPADEALWSAHIDDGIRAALHSAARSSGDAISDEQAVLLLGARGGALDELAGIADAAREASGNRAVTYVVNRNVDTSLLTLGGADEEVPTPSLTLDMVQQLAAEAAQLGASEICLQGRPAAHLPGTVYLDVVRAIREAAPELSIHGFRPTELQDGARRTGRSLPQFLGELREAGLGSVPGTAAVVLDDGVRAAFSQGQLPPAAEWIATVEAAHRAGLGSTSTLVFGHVETPAQVVAHLRALAALQERTGGFTEFIPMPFVPGDAPRALAALAGRGPSPEASRAVIAVSRLLLAGRIDHVQAAWTKLGLGTTGQVLRGGADDIGGVLLDGSLWPEAGPEARLTLTDADVESLARASGRPALRRDTAYRPIGETPVAAGRGSR
ncbi:7,8-didemethyl-8-hydroxy-5-deazariboflavin synthase CofG [Herbiconiux sp. CPCC 203407]|uniref:7,8-didemethyl-8-hydroxy-5-deazariboflavin synthase n=1 Tax=Herbiconiux oxytropis TaxID=2970915 RepID=A0AA41XHZ2_9MICO|nr:7,8-didemethyl-8-hydroxy-5-deazariboflavin synthase CofG [Herbiconiux oxytropis]MCS5723641.1 7,8-didemethyl-8-hydroxy-5-deazariboflavin synthase CofG [Herbiconiux oxytropis]MCS5726958.1 7,8-didemethyl-8-hydroxy-5-deazariboflavin synthase CofG [Herbiconiux oxytropis]